jgi:hypothetical protein
MNDKQHILHAVLGRYGLVGAKTELPSLAIQQSRSVEEELTVAVNLAFLDWVYNSPHPAVRRQMGPRLSATFASIRESMG